MTYKEFQEVNELLQDVPEGKRDKILNFMLRPPEGNPQTEQEAESMTLKFTKKEISRMPETFRKQFYIGNFAVKCRKRKSGKKHTNYEIRYNRAGYHIEVSSNDLTMLKEKFIRAVNDFEQKRELEKAKAAEEAKRNSNENFDVFARYYFETYRKRKVTEGTFKRDMYRYKHNLLPRFGDMYLTDITPRHCQELMDELASDNKTKTCSELYCLLNGIFKTAIAHGIIQSNPLSIVLVAKHEREHGSALTKAEEQKLLTECDPKFKRLFALALYTGLRPNEFYTVKVEKDFIVAVNSKRKKRKVEYKRIPIVPMLRPYLGEKFEFPSEQVMRKNFNAILPEHKLYDLRTTFYTRCEECGVAEAARDEFVGHSRGELNNAYSDLSDEYLLKEGAKLVW